MQRFMGLRCLLHNVIQRETGYKVGPRLREYSLLAPSGLGHEITQPRAQLCTMMQVVVVLVPRFPKDSQEAR